MYRQSTLLCTFVFSSVRGSEESWSSALPVFPCCLRTKQTSSSQATHPQNQDTLHYSCRAQLQNVWSEVKKGGCWHCGCSLWFVVSPHVRTAVVFQFSQSLMGARAPGCLKRTQRPPFCGYRVTCNIMSLHQNSVFQPECLLQKAAKQNRTTGKHRKPPHLFELVWGDRFPSWKG